MTLWFVFALMTAAAMFAVLLPLGLGGRTPADGREVAVYKDQLTEIERDVSTGLIGKPEAEAARIEISRRLLAAADQEQSEPVRVSRPMRRAAAVLALVGLPIAAVAIYLPLGSPKLADFPLAERTSVPASGGQPLEALVAQVQQHLQANPKDARGWTVLAPVLARLGRSDEAIDAYRKAIAYGGDNAARRADIGEVLAATSGGVVTADAKAEFERAHALDADEPKANYFLGLAAEQDGRKPDAAAIWRSMLAKAPADAPWRELVQTSLSRVGGGQVSGGQVPALPAETMAAAKDMTEGDRQTMIRGMVDRLATRLKQDGNDVEGWVRLVRAYVVLGETEKARSALGDARQALANDADRLRQLNDAAKDFGLDG